MEPRGRRAEGREKQIPKENYVTELSKHLRNRRI